MCFDGHAFAVINTTVGILGGPSSSDGGYRLGRKREGGAYEEDTMDATC